MKPRTHELYVNYETMAKLRFVAECVKASCPDEYAEQVLTEHMAALYPNLDDVIAKANRARKTVLEDARKELETNQQPTTKESSND